MTSETICGLYSILNAVRDRLENQHCWHLVRFVTPAPFGARRRYSEQWQISQEDVYQLTDRFSAQFLSDTALHLQDVSANARAILFEGLVRLGLPSSGHPQADKHLHATLRRHIRDTVLQDAIELSNLQQAHFRALGLMALPNDAGAWHVAPSLAELAQYAPSRAQFFSRMEADLSRNIPGLEAISQQLNAQLEKYGYSCIPGDGTLEALERHKPATDVLVVRPQVLNYIAKRFALQSTHDFRLNGTLVSPNARSLVLNGILSASLRPLPLEAHLQVQKRIDRAVIGDAWRLSEIVTDSIHAKRLERERAEPVSRQYGA